MVETGRDTEKTRATAGIWREGFLGNLRETCNVRQACEAAEVGRATAYRARERDEAFAAEWDAAIEEGVQKLEAEARRRAYAGVTATKVIQELDPETGAMRTVRQEAVQRYSDVLLMFLLKAHRPEVYRERVDLRHSGDAPTTTFTMKIESPNGKADDSDAGPD